VGYWRRGGEGDGQGCWWGHRKRTGEGHGLRHRGNSEWSLRLGDGDLDRLHDGSIGYHGHLAENVGSYGAESFLVGDVADLDGGAIWGDVGVCALLHHDLRFLGVEAGLENISLLKRGAVGGLVG